MLLIQRLDPSFLFHLVLDIPFSYFPAAVMSEATRFRTILGAVAHSYNIFVYSVVYLDISFSHHVYFQLPGNLGTHKTSCVIKIH